MHAIRWWVFPGDPWQITRAGDGAPNRSRATVYADFDAALQLWPKNTTSTTTSCSFRARPASPHLAHCRQQRAEPLGRARQLFAHYRDNPRILSLGAVSTEPEFDIWASKIAAEPLCRRR